MRVTDPHGRLWLLIKDDTIHFVDDRTGKNGKVYTRVAYRDVGGCLYVRLDNRMWTVWETEAGLRLVTDSSRECAIVK